MKRWTVLIATLGIVSSVPALANGPMPEDGGMTPEREQWTRKRIEHLRHEHQRQEAELRRLGTEDMGVAAYRMLNGTDPLEVNSADRERQAILRQREINTIEFLALKKERGELTPAGERKLRALIRDVRSRHR